MIEKSIDEVCSYGLTNHSGNPYMSIEDGETYYPAGLINMAFALGTLYFVRKLIWLWTEDELSQSIISLGFSCTVSRS